MKASGRIATGAAALTIALAGCSVNVYEAGSGEGGAAGGPGVADEQANTGRVSVAGAGTGVDGEAVQAVVSAATEGKEYSATYTGSDSFEQNVIIQIEGGTPPDLGMFPQPGTVVEQAAQGNLVALEDLGFDIADLEERFGEYMMSLGEFEGQHYGIPSDINFKSAVWYNVKAFEEAGYEIPETWDEMMALSEQIKADGTPPWCIGTGSEAATGWPATDWMEDIVLRQVGPEGYDRWVEGTLDFASPEIMGAAETFGEVLFTEGFVFGGHENITGTDFRDAPDPMFNDPPNCYLHRQATFIPAFFPEGLVAFEDYDFFPFPDIDGQTGSLMAGGLIAIFQNRPEIRDFLDSFTSADVQCVYGQQTQATIISANFNVELSCYENELIRQAAETLQGALRDEVARFDASDLMPPSVGSGSFWTGMNDYTSDGPDNLQSVMEGIDASWPADTSGDGESTGTGS